MEYFVISLLNGAIYGLLLFMVSAGLTVIFGMMGVLNFSHTSFYMAGAYIAYTLAKPLGFWPAILIAPLPVGLLGIVVERYFLRRVHRHGHAHELLVTFGLSLIIAEVVKLFYGNYPVDYHVPASLNFTAFHIFGSNYPAYRVFMGLISLAMFGVVYLLLTRTRAGIIVRSAIYKPRMAEALGHNVPLVFMGVFGVGAMLAGLAGAVAGAFYTTSPTMAAGYRRDRLRRRRGGRPWFVRGRDGCIPSDRDRFLLRGGHRQEPGRSLRSVWSARMG